MRGPSKPFGKYSLASRKGGSEILVSFRESDHSDWPARSNFGEEGSVQAGDLSWIKIRVTGSQLPGLKWVMWRKES